MYAFDDMQNVMSTPTRLGPPYKSWFRPNVIELNLWYHFFKVKFCRLYTCNNPKHIELWVLLTLSAFFLSVLHTFVVKIFQLCPCCFKMPTFPFISLQMLLLHLGLSVYNTNFLSTKKWNPFELLNWSKPHDILHLLSESRILWAIMRIVIFCANGFLAAAAFIMCCECVALLVIGYTRRL